MNKFFNIFWSENFFCFKLDFFFIQITNIWTVNRVKSITCFSSSASDHMKNIHTQNETSLVVVYFSLFFFVNNTILHLWGYWTIWKKMRRKTCCLSFESWHSPSSLLFCLFTFLYKFLCWVICSRHSHWSLEKWFLLSLPLPSLCNLFLIFVYMFFLHFILLFLHIADNDENCWRRSRQNRKNVVDILSKK